MQKRKKCKAAATVAAVVVAAAVHFNYLEIDDARPESSLLEVWPTLLVTVLLVSPCVLMFNKNISSLKAQ